jgi:hypothetical protein
MHFMWRTAGYILSDHKRKDEIIKELHTPQITEFIEKQRIYLKEYVGSMTADRVLKIILKYYPEGKKRLGRLLKRWKDSVM